MFSIVYNHTTLFASIYHWNKTLGLAESDQTLGLLGFLGLHSWSPITSCSYNKQRWKTENCWRSSASICFFFFNRHILLKLLKQTDVTSRFIHTHPCRVTFCGIAVCIAATSFHKDTHCSFKRTPCSFVYFLRPTNEKNSFDWIILYQVFCTVYL